MCVILMFCMYIHMYTCRYFSMYVCVYVGVNVQSFCKLGTDGALVRLLQGNKLRDVAMIK